MARPSDPALRPGILAACTQVAMAGGLSGLSLNHLSRAVRVSPRMLIYHFGSAEALISETLIGVQRLMRDKLQSRLVRDQNRDARKALRALWDYCTSHEMLPFFRSYYFFISETIGCPRRNAEFIEFSMNGFRDWIRSCLGEHRPPLSEADFSIVSGVLRGLLMDVLATGDRQRTTVAFQSFLDGFRFGFGGDDGGSPGLPR
ncbi:MAG: TetR/AcrR family transcriptional regulator [Holophaga sp.]|nr:TetR/AcrR family transcriptional regulator [Holophaga sp.]